MSQPVREQANLQTYTLEYITTGAFDGETLAPVISLDPTSPDFVEPDPVDGIYRLQLPEGQSLGLIDLSLFGGDAGGVGDRYVRWMLAGNTVGQSFLGGELGVFDDTQRRLFNPAASPLLLELWRSLNGVQGFYENSCLMVPQGSYLGISGLAAAAGGVNVVRFNVQAPRTPWEAALVEESCCCDDGNGGDPDTSCPEIVDISPSALPPIGNDSPPLQLTIFGTGFRDGLAIQASLSPGPGEASLTQFTVVDSSTATVLVVFPTGPGTYLLTIFDPEDPEGCSSSGQFTVGIDGDCPFISELNRSGFIINITSNDFIATGTNLDIIDRWEIRQGPDVRAFQDAIDFTNQTPTELESGPFGFLGGTTPGDALLVFMPADPDSCPEISIPVTLSFA